MTCAELGPILPILAYVLAVIFLGVSHEQLRVPLAVCEAFGIIIYMVEIRERFRGGRGGRR